MIEGVTLFVKNMFEAAKEALEAPITFIPIKFKIFLVALVVAFLVSRKEDRRYMMFLKMIIVTFLIYSTLVLWMLK